MNFTEILVFLRKFLLFVYSFFSVNPLPAPHHVEKPTSTKIEDYVETRKRKFYRDISGGEYNENIDPVFYSAQEYKKILEIPNNELEVFWKRRILYESTPIGNMVFFYDPYKHAFSYYSDQRGVPYSILNAGAMKYVVHFRCLDFYADENTRPNNTMSRLFQEKEKEPEKKAAFSKPASDLPFAKLKNYQQEQSTTAPIKEFQKNKFVYLGRISNFNVLQKANKSKPPPPPIQIEMSQDFDGTSTQMEVFNYREYKKLKEKMSLGIS